VISFVYDIRQGEESAVKMKVLPILLSDSYKQHHVWMYPQGMIKLYSNMTPRSYKRIAGNVSVFFGLQYYIKEYLIKQWNELFFNRPLEEVVAEYKRFHKHFSFSDVTTEHIEKLHKLGYMPIKIKALPEGTKVPERVPYFTITNTHPDFAWLVNFLETQMSTVIWDLCVNATVANEYKELLTKWAQKTGDPSFVQWQAHDFSMRGRSSIESTFNQAGHLLSFTGTDTIPAVLFLEEYYGANIENELVGSSVPASEHSVMTSYGKEDEIVAFERILDQFPEGIVSVVSDSFDLWKVCTEYVITLKDKIMARNGKLVIRPDSGNPVDIICGQKIESFENEYCVLDYMFHKLSEETPHGEYGGDLEEVVKIKDKYYNATFSPEWNRHDKQYYYIDSAGIDKLELVEIDCKPEFKGVVELLWGAFGGTVNEKGYKVLDSHISTIYGDSINLERAEQICKRLEAKGFASTNVVLGIGSYTYNYNTRDTLGLAVKSTYCEVATKDPISGGFFVEQREIFKDPVTDDGVKKSARGLLRVDEVDGVLTLKDRCTHEEEQGGLLTTVFQDGKLVRETTLSEIRARLNEQ
jgi:nicotinamide phosphoribosyltransferase